MIVINKTNCKILQYLFNWQTPDSTNPDMLRNPPEWRRLSSIWY